ncbi:hypothetical protein [Mycolicibacterium iranicum]|uniref:Uncharacterized protein n=1 Tax=Mycolicibacterium iranicum TaxID=912594 RepID=A0A178LSA8_MYCIR|nr:hypothetical protein [Mycolicibacterium iranicum]OAN36801.1 hypothetical protein A4X20_06305 [Mycolicibacterium iranicum]
MVTVGARPDAVDEPRPAPGGAVVGWIRHAPTALLAAAIALWLSTLPTLTEATAGQYGLLAADGGMALLVSALVTIIGFAWAITIHRTALAAVAVVVTLLIYRVTATVVTEMPLYVWTYKHIGIANYMIDGHASPNVRIYGDWPTFFASMAWFSSVSGVDSLVLAHWFAPVAAGLVALLVATLVMCAGFDARSAVTAAMLAIIVNWTGQDYYSPQAAALILALAVLSLLLYSKQSAAAGYLSLPLLAVLVATHQLTPFWMLVVITALAVIKQIQPRWLPLAFAAILAAYVIPRLGRAASFDLFSGFNPLKNSVVVAHEQGSGGREFTMLLERGLFVVLWVLALVCAIVIWRRRQNLWGIVVIAFSSLTILAGQDYGGEAIIRVFLYSIAGCAALLAVVVSWATTLEHRGWRIAGCLVSASILAVGGAIGLHGYYSGWSYVTISRAQVEHSRELLRATEGRYVIGTLAQNVGWPEGSTAESVRLRLQDPTYDAVFDSLRASLQHKDFATPHDVALIEEALPRNSRARALYVVLPDQAAAYGEYLGRFPATYVPSLIELLSQTPQWTRVIDSEDTVVFEYQPANIRGN